MMGDADFERRLTLFLTVAIFIETHWHSIPAMLVIAALVALVALRPDIEDAYRRAGKKAAP